MTKLLLVDGMNLFFQMFFGMPARILNAQGKAIQGTLGFVGALIKIIRWTEPTHLAVFFDGEHPNPRAALDDGYKANRVDYATAPEEQNPFSQLGDVYAALRFMKIRHAELTEWETDDVIAGYTDRYGKEADIVIASWDSDFFQLIGENVRVLRYRGKQSVLCDSAYVEERFGVPSSWYAAFKSLTGDKADNIPGAEMVGAKTAAALLRQFGSLEEIIRRADQIAKPSVAASILRNAERLRTNYRLIKLENRGSLPFPLDELACAYDGAATRQVLQGIGLG